MIDVIINPVAGNGLAKKIGKNVCEYLTQQGIEFNVYKTEYKRHATELAKASANRKTKIVFSVGGDGTAFEIAGGLLNSNTALAVIPAGTGNDFIKSLNLPSDPLEVLKKVLSCSPRPVDIGLANENVFLNACGTGFDVMVIDFAEKAKKYLKGILPYFYGLIITIFHHKPYLMKIVLDNDTEIEGEYLICSVANGRYIGGGIPVAPKAEVNDGYFDVVLIENVPRYRIPLYLVGLMRKKILEFDVTHFYRAKRVKISGKNMRVNEDGEVISANEIVFTNLPSSLLVYW